METKLLEVRDRGTMMVVIGIRPAPRSDIERQMMYRCGFNTPQDYVLLGDLDGGKFAMTYDKYDYYQSSRTKFVAYGYIQEHWDELQSGDLIDVELILGESTEMKASEFR